MFVNMSGNVDRWINRTDIPEYSGHLVQISILKPGSTECKILIKLSEI